MDIANMRTLGVRSIEVWCECGHHVVINADPFRDQLELSALQRRMTCSACGKRPRDLRPDWREMRHSGMGR